MSYITIEATERSREKAVLHLFIKNYQSAEYKKVPGRMQCHLLNGPGQKQEGTSSDLLGMCLIITTSDQEESVSVVSAPPAFPFSNHRFLWQKLQLSLFLLRNGVRPLRMLMLSNQTKVVLGSTRLILHSQRNPIQNP